MKNKDRLIKWMLAVIVFLSFLFIVLGVLELYNEDENEKIDIQKVIDSSNNKKDFETLKLRKLDSGIIILKEEFELK